MRVAVVVVAAPAAAEDDELPAAAAAEEDDELSADAAVVPGTLAADVVDEDDRERELEARYSAIGVHVSGMISGVEESRAKRAPHVDREGREREPVQRREVAGAPRSVASERREEGRAKAMVAAVVAEGERGAERGMERRSKREPGFFANFLFEVF